MHINIFNLLFIFLFSLISCKEEDSRTLISDNYPLEIIMHRGLTFGEIAPANSLDAISLAQRVGAKKVELDIIKTYDNVFVLGHDYPVYSNMRNAADYSEVDNLINISNLTFKDFTEKYILASDNPSMRRPAPSLKEALTLCKTSGIYPYIEVKPSILITNDDIKNIYDLSCDILGKNNFAITCTDLNVIKQFRILDNSLVLCCDFIHDTNIIDKYKLSYYPPYKAINEEVIKHSHKNGYRVNSWTVPKEAFDSIAGLNIDGVLSDDIAPTFNISKSIFNDYTDETFSNYVSDGEITNNTIHLKKGQKIKLNKDIDNNILLGAIYFSVEFKGNILIKANNFEVKRNNSKIDFISSQFQYFIYKEKELPYFEIEALADKVVIKSLWFAVNKF